MRLLITVLAVSFTACGAMPQPGPMCQAPSGTKYPDADFTTNAAAELRLVSQLSAFNAALRASELDAGIVADRATFDGLLNAGAPSLSSIVPASFKPVVDEALTSFVAGQGKRFVPAATPVAPGGLYGDGSSTWLLSERGLDLHQVIDKGFYGAMLLGEAKRREVTTPAQVDQLLALYGAPPSFPQADTGTIKDDLGAKYAKRRTAPGAEGPYTRIRDAFIQARYAAGLKGCETERDAALATLRTEWELALASTAIFYVFEAGEGLAKAAPTVAEKASAMHGLGEGVGFVMGLRALPAASRKATDAQLDQALAALKAPSLSTATAHRLLTDSPPDVDGVLQAATKLQQAFGFSADDVNRFKTAY